MFEAYVAGFLDADGSVSLHRDRKDKPDYMKTPSVEFYNCDKNILEKIQEKWGGNIKTKTPRKNNHNISYTLTIRENKALELLISVFPFMMHEKKKTRASLLIEHYKKCTPRNGKYTIEEIEKKNWLNEQFNSIIMRGV